jgi:hypothetical protein
MHKFYHVFYGRDLIHTQHHHNNHTTTLHMRVGPSVWGPPSCEGLLCWCCKFNIFLYGKDFVRIVFNWLRVGCLSMDHACILFFTILFHKYLSSSSLSYMKTAS